jgi:hypothetical protein
MIIYSFDTWGSKAGYVRYHDRNGVNGAYFVEADLFHGGLVNHGLGQPGSTGGR